MEQVEEAASEFDNIECCWSRVGNLADKIFEPGNLGAAVGGGGVHGMVPIADMYAVEEALDTARTENTTLRAQMSASSAVEAEQQNQQQTVAAQQQQAAAAQTSADLRQAVAATKATVAAMLGASEQQAVEAEQRQRQAAADLSTAREEVFAAAEAGAAVLAKQHVVEVQKLQQTIAELQQLAALAEQRRAAMDQTNAELYQAVAAAEDKATVLQAELSRDPAPSVQGIGLFRTSPGGGPAAVEAASLNSVAEVQKAEAHRAKAIEAGTVNLNGGNFDDAIKWCKWGLKASVAPGDAELQKIMQKAVVAKGDEELARRLERASSPLRKPICRARGWWWGWAACSSSGCGCRQVAATQSRIGWQPSAG